MMGAELRRRAGPGRPTHDQGARARAIWALLSARPAWLSLPVRPYAKEQEEVYVVVRESGRMKLDDEIVEVKEWNAVRVPHALSSFWVRRLRIPGSGTSEPPSFRGFRRSEGSCATVRGLLVCVGKASRRARAESSPPGTRWP